jgi:saccharopine dehydrogenase-like NADP-dependent oxidoreductase
LPDIGEFDGYANRDSLKFRELYQLQHIPTFFRGTLRKRGFCKAWDIFVQLGLTDDSYVIEGSEHMTYRQFINSSMVYRKHDTVELKLCYHLGVSVDSREMYMLKWLGIFEERKIGLKNATPADIMLSLLERKWKMRPEDKDMVVMHNIIHYNDIDGISRCLKSTMKVIGDDASRTAMAKTVGLPLAIATRMVLTGEISMVGVHVPTKKEIYEPVLRELAENGITFQVTDSVMTDSDE